MRRLVALLVVGAIVVAACSSPPSGVRFEVYEVADRETLAAVVGGRTEFGFDESLILMIDDEDITEWDVMNPNRAHRLMLLDGTIDAGGLEGAWLVLRMSVGNREWLGQVQFRCPFAAIPRQPMICFDRYADGGVALEGNLIDEASGRLVIDTAREAWLESR